MLNRVEEAQEQWGGSHSAIDNWLDERKELLVRYCSLAGLPPFEQKESKLPGRSDVESFCQVLMDYVSTGHFEVYNQVASQCEQKGPDSIRLAENIYPKIVQSTDVALTFNDKYAEFDENKLSNSFDEDLSGLGQSMEERFELEDKLIQTLYSNHS